MTWWKMMQGTNHKEGPQNFRDFEAHSPPPCLQFGLIFSTKFTHPPSLCLLLGQPPSVQTPFMNGPQFEIVLIEHGINL